MDFSLTEEQAMLRDSVRHYLHNEYDFSVRRTVVEKQGGFDRERWKVFADMGWLGVALPEEFGGIGSSAIEDAIVLEEIGRGLVVEPFLAVAVLAAQTIHLAGSEAQRRKLLPSLIGGESLIVLAHNESTAHGHLRHLMTSAKADGGGRYLLNGRKSLLFGGSVADRFVVSARTSGGVDDADGITLFVLSPEMKGVRRHDYRLIDGSAACDLILEDVAVGPDDVLGEIGHAFHALDLAHSHAIIGICAEALGVMDRALWTTRDYLLERKQFGVPIASFQALQHRMADMVIALEQSRAMVHCALAALASNDGNARRHAVSAAKAQVGRAGRFVGAQGIQLHGGIGMTNEYIIGHSFKRLIVIDGCFGNGSFHLSEMARDYSSSRS